MYQTGIHMIMIMKFKKMSNRKSTEFNGKSTIFGIILKTKEYKTIRPQLVVIPRIDFRPKRRKRASGTEVCEGAGRKTSVLNVENGPRGRKSASAYVEKLPSKMVKPSLGDGSLQVHM